VGCERDPAQPWPAVRAQDEGVEVVVVDVTVGEAHRLATVRPHDRQGLGVVVGVEQAHLATDQLRVRAWSSPTTQQTHLRGDTCEGVPTVDADLVRVARVVAGRAGEVAAREDPVRPLATHPVPAEHLTGSTHDRRQPGPPLGERRREIRVDRAGPPLGSADGRPPPATDPSDPEQLLPEFHG